jgi:valyl-tRNA synthetase
MSEPPNDLESRTRFEPSEVEPRIGARWLDSGLFHPEPEGHAADNYSIAIPPPNVTGSLHMGHALNGSIQDVLIRYHRMSGRRTKWILGTDHAGIATQAQVEKALRAEGTTRQELGREEFVRRVWDWREHYGHTIVEQLKRLGASCDYSEERFTLDEGYHRAVVAVFVTLYEQGLIYRDRYIVNWDPGSHSAISDLEVEERRERDTLYSIRYDLEPEGGAGGQGPAGRNGDAQASPGFGRAPRSSDCGEVTIATVRPETMLGDTAVAVHPDDERYRELVGRHAILPLVGRHLPIVADEYVKMEFGTGQLKVTPAHDPNDFEIGRRHELDQVSVIGEDGRLTSEAGERFAGLTVMEARAAVVAALREEGRIVAEEEYEHEVPYSHRSGERIEPLISLQWFMRMDELAGPAIDAVRDGRVRIVPDNHRRVYLEWMDNIRPWCISRQLWWGHRLPVYYCATCSHLHVAASAPEGCAACGGQLRQEEDVLDTWFSSALWPFATLGWPDDTPQLRAFYPTAVLSTARDILFLWVARMIMMGLRFTGEAPFADVYIHSVIQAPDGRRMSKSLGTGIDPLDEIDRHGADAVRFGLLAMSSSQDVRYSAEKVRQGQALANKLFNATRFALLRIAGLPGVMDRDTTHAIEPAPQPGGIEPAPRPTTIEDRWILSRLQEIVADTAARIEDYDFSHAALGLYDFVYAELCDWYLEIVKPRLAGASAQDDGEAAGGMPGDGEARGVAGDGEAGGMPGDGEARGVAGDGEAGGMPGDGEVRATTFFSDAYQTVAAAREDREALAATLLYVLRETVALAHPLIPFVTEELWSYLDRSGELLAGARYPRADVSLIDRDVEIELERAIEAVTLVRGWRDSVNAPPGMRVRARIDADGYESTAAILANLARLDLGDGDGAGDAGVPSVASISVPCGTVEVLSAEGLDLGAAERRRAAGRAKLEEEIARVEGKLANAGFVQRAPAEVVEGERAKLARLRGELEAL